MNQTENDTVKQKIINLEQTIRAYKQEYPHRFAEMFHTNAYYLMWIAATILWWVKNVNPDVTQYCVIGSAVFSLFGGLSYIRKKDKIKLQATSIRKQVDKALLPIEKLDKDPVIKNYLKQCKKAIRTIDEEKTAIKKRFYIFVTIYCITVGVIVALLLTPRSVYESLYETFISPDKHKKVNIYNVRRDGTYFDNLHLSTYEPFISLKPLTKDINETIKLQSDVIDFFLIEPNGFEIKTPKIEGGKDSRFRITITDLKGNPVKHAPYIDFYNDGLIITEHSYPISHDIVANGYYGEHSHNDYEALRMLHYLQDNQDQLRYVVQLKE